MDILHRDMPEELIEDILIHLPPDEPASLVRAGLVCKSWCRTVSSRGFRRRYRAFHRSPPLLGFLHDGYDDPDIPLFVSTTSASPFSSLLAVLDDCSRRWWPIDCRHGRVLLHTTSPYDGLVVWVPATNDRHHLRNLPAARQFVAAVVCPVDTCDHLDGEHDGGGPFTVVLIAEDIHSSMLMRVSVYSSETRSWSESVSVLDAGDHPHCRCISSVKPSFLACGGTLYFTIDCRGTMLKYDLGEQQLSILDRVLGYGQLHQLTNITATMDADGGGLRLVTDNMGNCIDLWKQQQEEVQSVGATSSDGGTRWVKYKTINLEMTPLLVGRYQTSAQVIGFAEGTDTIFIINRDGGMFTLDLKSRQMSKVAGSGPYYQGILPYMTFYTPDLAKGRLSPL